jgi:hypothetical protein
MGGLLSRRLAVYDVEFVAGTEDDGTLSYLSGTHCLDMFGGVTLCRSLGDLETLRVDIDALVGAELPERVLATRAPIIAGTPHQGRVLPRRLGDRPRGGPDADGGDPDGQQSAF